MEEKRKILQLGNLPNNNNTQIGTVMLTSLHNNTCPICFSEFYDSLDSVEASTPTAATTTQQRHQQSISVLALQCNHAVCRECLISLEKHKLTLLGDSTTTSSCGAVTPSVGSVRCPYCSQRTAYNCLRKVLLTNNNSNSSNINNSGGGESIASSVLNCRMNC